MFALYATGHDGLTPSDIAALPDMPGRGHLLRWLETGGQCRLANSEHRGDLRELRSVLRDRGLTTEVHRAPGFTPPPAAAVTYDDFPAAPPATDSGVHQYRQMMAEIDSNRSTRDHKTSVAFRMDPAQIAVLCVFAVLGILLAMAA